MPEHNNGLTYHLLRVPLRTGSLYPSACSGDLFGHAVPSL
jgi:hypothetical protein